MTVPLTETSARPRRVWRSVGAVFAGIVAIFVLSLGIDEVLHLLKVYPPWSEPMFDPRLNALALSYRLVIGVIGGYVTAKLAPQNPMRHAIILGVIGLALSTVGAIGAMQMNLGPSWYPILLAVTALPCAWLGGVLQRRWHGHKF
jgi:hypothetical protein